MPSKRKPLNKKVKESGDSYSWIWLPVAAIVVSVVHSGYLHVLFENDRYFTHLSELEKELSFKTEMGLYYSYFKSIVTSSSFMEGVTFLLHDNRTEFPNTINTLQRFNLYPEVMLGGMFRMWKTWLAMLGSSGMQCYPISRGFNQPPVTACAGLGDPASFYVWCVFALNGVLVGIIFSLAAYLSGSVFGGLLSVVCFFYNHGEATRVMWTPPLRESFALPFLFLQSLAVTRVIRSPSARATDLALVGVSSVLFLLPWQFSQFVLVTQCMCLLVLHVTRLLSRPHITGLYWTVGMTLLVNIVLQFANSLLLTSLLPCTVIACLVVVYLSPVTNRIPFRLLRMALEVGGVLVLVVLVKLALQKALAGGDDAHIVAIFLSKFTSYKDFHTQLYTCAAEFDFLPFSYVLELSATFVLPVAALVMGVVIYGLLTHLWRRGSIAPPLLAEQVYQVFQTLAYGCLAFLIMRLKLFLTPQLCVLVALLARPKFISQTLSPRVLLGVLLIGSSFKGTYNLWQQWNILGEFNYPEMEQLVLWANQIPESRGVVFGGAMPTMANLRLSTNHSVADHPHYEDSQLRRRVKAVYTIYSRRSPEEIHATLHALQITHVVVEPPWCREHSGKPGCALPEVWDMEDPSHQGQPTFCDGVLYRNEISEDYFERVFHNNLYTVLQVKAV